MNFTPEDDRLVLYLFSALLMIPVIGVVFAIGAQAAFRQRSLPRLLGCWIVGTTGVTALMIWRIHQQQALLGLRVTPIPARSLWSWFLPMWALAFAFVCLRIWRRRALAEPSVVRSAVASLPSFLGGLLLFFASFAAIDWFQ